MPLEIESDLVQLTGAQEGDLLVGVKELNRGLRVRVQLAQDKGDRLQIRGGFDLISVGNGRYAAAMSEFVGRRFESAQELIGLVRLTPGAEKCTYILHKDLLRVEESAKPSHTEVLGNTIQNRGGCESAGKTGQCKWVMTADAMMKQISREALRTVLTWSMIKFAIIWGAILGMLLVLCSELTRK